MASTDLDRRRETSNFGKVVALVNVLEILTGYVDFIEFGMMELVQVAAVLIKRLSLPAAIQTPFVHIAPILEAEDVLLERKTVFHKVSFDGALHC